MSISPFADNLIKHAVCWFFRRKNNDFLRKNEFGALEQTARSSLLKVSLRETTTIAQKRRFCAIDPKIQRLGDDKIIFLHKILQRLKDEYPKNWHICFCNKYWKRRSFKHNRILEDFILFHEICQKTSYFTWMPGLLSVDMDVRTHPRKIILIYSNTLNISRRQNRFNNLPRPLGLRACRSLKRLEVKTN